MSGNKGNPVIIFIALMLTATLVGAWAAWLREDRSLAENTPRLIFTWLLVVSDMFLLVTRAVREWTDRR